MPSKQSAAVRGRWEASRLAMVQPGFDAPDDESWGDLTAEPRGVDYLETEAAGLPAMWAVPKGASTDRVLMCIHGGGFMGGSIYTHRKVYGHLAKAAGMRALLVSYRLLPEGVFPAPEDDVTNAYRWLLDQGISAGRIAFAGDSVGGWLAVTVQLRARELGLPLPAAALLMSPCVDMETTGKSYETNQDSDPFFKRDVVRGIIRGFLGEDTDARDPRANPLYADLSGCGPLYIQAGETRRSPMTPGCCTSTPRRPGSTRAWTSSLTCCTPSRWPRAGRRRPTTRSASWPAGYGPA